MTPIEDYADGDSPLALVPEQTPYGSRYVPGQGPMPCRSMLIGEGPGVTENEHGIPFYGQSGQLLDRLLWMEGIRRDDVYVTNLVKYHVPGNADPTEEDINRDAADLAAEIKAVQPEYIGLLGRVTSRHFLGDVDMEWCHGLQWHRKREPDLMPMYHPAAGLHSPALLSLVATDIHQFALMVKGKLEVQSRVDAFPKPRYILLKDKLPKLDYGLVTYIDTEGSVAKPWGLSFTQQPGQGFVILAGNTKLLEEFAFNISNAQTPICLHNSMHDIPVLRAMGITFTHFYDTMIRAYHLGIEPQGLKPLARRHASMVQDSYDDVIRDARKAKCTKYFLEALRWLDKHWVEESETFSRASKKKKPTPKPRTTAKRSTSSLAGTNSRTTSRTRSLSSSKSVATSRKRRSTTSR